MKTNKSSTNHSYLFIQKTILATILAFAPIILFGGEIPTLLDDFSNDQHNSLGYSRMVIDDTTSGGKSTSTQTVQEGVLKSTGKLVPPRGQPAWVSMVNLLNPNGEPADISQYDGVYLQIRIHEGMISLSVNSTDVVNFDYHAAMVAANSKELSEVRIPFSSMKRAWSEQTKLNTKSVASVSLVAVGLQPGSFSYEIDEIGFY